MHILNLVSSRAKRIVFEVNTIHLRLISRPKFAIMVVFKGNFSWRRIDVTNYIKCMEVVTDPFMFPLMGVIVELP